MASNYSLATHKHQIAISISSMISSSAVQTTSSVKIITIMMKAVVVITRRKMSKKAHFITSIGRLSRSRLVSHQVVNRHPRTKRSCQAWTITRICSCATGCSTRIPCSLWEEQNNRNSRSSRFERFKSLPHSTNLSIRIKASLMRTKLFILKRIGRIYQ